MEGYKVCCCEDGLEGWNIFNKQAFDLCILDVMLPKQDGFTVAEMIRKKNMDVPIIFLTAKSMKEDVYRGFETGADDYIIKPFTARELILRIKAILRRRRTNENTRVNGDENGPVYKIGKFVFDYASREIMIDDIKKNLSTKENEILRIFCERKNTVINRERILTEVWGNDDYFVSKSLDVYITRLRKILNADASISIQNYHSIGYKMIVKHTND